MAKNKSSAALFEVITKDKRLDRKTTEGGGLRTPKWWFKSRSRSSPPAMPIPASEPRVTAHPAADAGIPSFHEPAVPAGHREVVFRFNYHTALLLGFGLAVALGGAFIIGKRMASVPATVLGGQPIEEIKRGPVQAGVLDLGRGGNEVETVTIEPDDSPSVTTTSQTAQNRPQTWNDPRPPATLVIQDAKRNIGLNYVVVQSYADIKFAEEARDTLLANGVGCTIEQKLRGWSGRLFLVVGIDGFNRISSPEFKAYVKRIETISNKAYPPNSYKAFQPIAYKWDRE